MSVHASKYNGILLLTYTILEQEIFSPINILIKLKPAAKVNAQKRLILREFTLAAYLIKGLHRRHEIGTNVYMKTDIPL